MLGRRLEGLGWDVAIGYGLSETSPLITVRTPGRSPLDTVGRPVAGVEVRIDPEVPGGGEGAGEILVRGPNLFSGYHGLPERSAESFTADGWFRTGDLGRLDRAGDLRVLGRVSTLIVTEGGEKVQPDELEAAYAESPLVRELGVLQEDGRLVALVVPETGGEAGAGSRERIRAAIDERARDLPSYKRLGALAVTRQPLPRTRLGKIRRAELEARYREASREGPDEERGPMALEEMSEEDRALLDHPAARRTWEWLEERYPGRRITPDTSPRLDLGVDSLEWMNLTLDLAERLGVELGDEAIGRIESVRDLLAAATEARDGGGRRVDPREAPEELLSATQRRWLEPLPPAAEWLARGVYGLNRLLLRGLFRLRVEGAERVPADAQVLLAPTHGSFLDPFLIGAALPYRTLRRAYWGGWTGAAFGNPLKRAFSRLTHTVPVDPEKGAISSLAFGAAVLRRGHSLVWFPEGRRSTTGEIQAFRPGVGLLLEGSEVPAVPVAIRGAHEALPPGRALPVPGRRIRVRFGEPVLPEALAREGEGEGAPERIVEALRARTLRLADGED
jgi:long-chain acyl-CoA synthetase